MTIHPGGGTRDRQNASGGVIQALPSVGLATISEGLCTAAEHPGPPQQYTIRKSLAVAPKRGPLQQIIKPVQGVTFPPDQRGDGTGKENIPPGSHSPSVIHQQERPCRILKAQPVSDSKLHRTKDVVAESPHPLPRAAKQRSPETRRRQQQSTELTVDSTAVACAHDTAKGFSDSSGSRRSMAVYKDLGHSRRHDATRIRSSCPPKPPQKLIMPRVEVHGDVVGRYPVLGEEISRPEMYEDSWLSHQEAAITQLLNGLFHSAMPIPWSNDMSHSPLMRQRMLEQYNEAPFPLLHKRLQASILYGALSLPKDALCSALRYRDDLGVKRRFLDLWLKTFDVYALKAALEVVIGRQIDQEERVLNGRPSPSEPIQKPTSRRDVRAVEAFLEAFLVRNEDSASIVADIGSIASITRNSSATTTSGSKVTTKIQAYAWRRTLLRSLMLIRLLDHAKSTGVIHGCLFLPDSSYKSTAAVLHAIRHILVPSHGDLTRTLSHLDYHTCHVQYPLQEYCYHIDSLATDFRDGVRLTRVVELLLYPPSTLPQGQVNVTITMPMGEILKSRDGLQDNSWVLSQHLKFPTLGRATRLYNTEVALASLDGVTRGTANVAGVRAEDLVDGHREKTVGLLWGLVSRWGMDSLLDWHALEGEICRLKSTYRARQAHTSPMNDLGASDNSTGDDRAPQADEEEDEFEQLTGFDRQTYLLKSWSAVIAKLHGLHVHNLSTSFADGRILGAIVAEYEKYFPKPSSAAPPTVDKLGLDVQLKRLGCSNYFGEADSRRFIAPSHPGQLDLRADDSS